MKRTQLLLICLLAVASLFFNAACSPKPEPEVDLTNDLPQNGQFYHRGKTKDLEVLPESSSSHQVGAIVRQGESIRLTYKSASAYADITLTLKAGGFTLKSNSNLAYSSSTTANRVTYCWGEDNCFIATKNRDNSWTIKRLPFQSSTSRSRSSGTDASKITPENIRIAIESMTFDTDKVEHIRNYKDSVTDNIKLSMITCILNEFDYDSDALKALDLLNHKISKNYSEEDLRQFTNIFDFSGSITKAMSILNNP